MKPIFFSIILFIVTGELLIRFDEDFSPFGNRVVKINTEFKITPEYNLLMSNSIDTNANNLRILILGDSYIHGGGIDFKNNFSSHLKSILNKNNKKFDDIFVLDASKAQSNNFDNAQTYFLFSKKFKPQIVVIGFTYDGVSGDLDKKVQSVTINRFGKARPSGSGTFLISKILRIIYSSRFTHLILTSLHDNLKVHGFIMPNSEYDLKIKSYYQNRENWIRSKKILQNMIEDAEKNNIQLIVIKFPEINLMKYNKLFTKADSTISLFFHGYQSVKYVDGSYIFKKDSSKEFMLSKFDGHLNESGHRKLATHAAKIIDSLAVVTDTLDKLSMTKEQGRPFQ